MTHFLRYDLFCHCCSLYQCFLFLLFFVFELWFTLRLWDDVILSWKSESTSKSCICVALSYYSNNVRVSLSRLAHHFIAFFFSTITLFSSRFDIVIDKTLSLNDLRALLISDKIFSLKHVYWHRGRTCVLSSLLFISLWSLVNSGIQLLNFIFDLQ
jgi:hypothetical protein